MKFKPIGYLYKQVAEKPDWLKAKQVSGIYSLSNCISDSFSDYINYWRHNGYWLFDSPIIMEEIALAETLSLKDHHLFYYEAYEKEFDPEIKCWNYFAPEPSFDTNIELPSIKSLEGFDVVSFFCHTSPECSPLSCNALAEELDTNQHCLFDSFDTARQALEQGLFDNSEPSPFRIIAVYSIPGAET